MNTISALQALYVALGGDADDVANINTIPEMISAIATQAAKATAPELPTVTATENGKVLKVVNGKWAVGTDEIQA
jgi:hypothetical protein